MVESHVRDRDRVVETLSRLRQGPTAEATAGLICRELRSGRALPNVALMAFPGEGRKAVPLACEGALSEQLPVGQPLPAPSHDRIDDYPAIRKAVDRCRGVRLSVDDAGSGYACLRHVLALDPAFVKLDRGWISGIEADPARQALVAGLGQFTATTGAALIAEGIERPEEVEALRSLEVPLGQGFLLGRPAPAP